VGRKDEEGRQGVGKGWSLVRYEKNPSEKAWVGGWERIEGKKNGKMPRTLVGG